MRFKLDENLDVRLASLFAEVGQEAKTVLEEYGPERGWTKPTD